MKMAVAAILDVEKCKIEIRSSAVTVEPFDSYVGRPTYFQTVTSNMIGQET